MTTSQIIAQQRHIDLTTGTVTEGATIAVLSRAERAYARLSAAQDAEREALLWCAAAQGATEEVKTAREAHLITARVDLAQARSEWEAVIA